MPAPSRREPLEPGSLVARPTLQIVDTEHRDHITRGRPGRLVSVTVVKGRGELVDRMHARHAFEDWWNETDFKANYARQETAIGHVAGSSPADM